jgi:cbb3-type cytochrome oxidase subunit 3
MLTFMKQSGPFILLQFVLAWVILLLTLVNIVRLALRKGRRAAGLRTSIDAILFWGCLTAVFGFLGQWVGLNRAANAIVEAHGVSPPMVVLGFGESLGTTVFGMFTLAVAACLWFALRVTQHRRAQHHRAV